MAEAVQARLFFVSGLVQGVGYRYFAQRVAARTGVSGYAKNLRDGRVEVYAVGTPSQLKSLRAELARGPAMADVSGIGEQEAEIEPGYERGFVVEHDG